MAGGETAPTCAKPAQAGRAQKGSMVKSESSLAGSGRARRPLRLSTGITLSVAFILMCIIFIALSADFASWANIKNIMRTLSVVGVVAIGETLVLLSLIHISEPTRLGM